MSEKKELFDYTAKKTKKEIIWFYIQGVIAGVVFSYFLRWLFAITIWGERVPKYSYDNLGITVAWILTIMITLRILYNKNLWKNPKAVLLGILAILLVWPFGIFGGFLPAAILLAFEPHVD